MTDEIPIGGGVGPAPTGGVTDALPPAAGPAPAVGAEPRAGTVSGPVDPYAHLAGLGLRLPEVVPPIAAYVPAVQSGRLVYVSGQLPIVDGTLPVVGRVGAEVPPEQAFELARRAGLNALAAIDAIVGLEKVVKVVKVVGFVACADGFTEIPAVVNGASELFVAVFGEAGRHARSTIGVAGLPLGAPVEVEMIVEVTD